MLSLILVVPLGSAYMAYRAHKATEALRQDVERLEGELAYWRDTGGRLMEGLVRDQDRDLRERPNPG